jgi:hypothetical protein
MTLSTSHWPADFSQPVVDVTVGDAPRGAAAEAPPPADRNPRRSA